MLRDKRQVQPAVNQKQFQNDQIIYHNSKSHPMNIEFRANTSVRWPHPHTLTWNPMKIPNFQIKLAAFIFRTHWIFGKISNLYMNPCIHTQSHRFHGTRLNAVFDISSVRFTRRKHKNCPKNDSPSGSKNLNQLCHIFDKLFLNIWRRCEIEWCELQTFSFLLFFLNRLYQQRRHTEWKALLHLLQFAACKQFAINGCGFLFSYLFCVRTKARWRHTIPLLFVFLERFMNHMKMT